MSEIDVATILRAGGIAPHGAKAPKGERAGEVCARAYAHPALPGRVVVRLSTDAIAPGADVEMETLGFGAPAVTGKLGLQRYRALGFPGWALVHDPARAKFALDVMKDFKKAAARVRSKPGHARDAFVAIGDRLARTVPHFLPSFWEEAGRAFLAEGSESFAAQAFEKARLTEKEHALAVDEDVRGAVFLEFALAGAVGVKSLQAYAKVLVSVFGDAEGYERFFELTRRRTLGGMPPWTGMAKDLRALAKGAGKDLDREDERLLSEVLSCNAIQSAPAEFWTTYERALVRLAKAKPEVRDRLRQLFAKPSRGDDGFKGKWLDLLDACGALGAVTATTGEEATRLAHGMAADWLEKLLAYANWEPKVAGLVERMAPRLAAEGTNVQLAQGSRWWRALNLDVVELALTKKIPIEEPPDAARFHLDRPFALDPIATSEDPRFKKRLADAVGQVMGRPDFEKRAAGKAGLVAARRAWLEALVARAKGGAIVDLEGALEEIAKRTSAATFAEFPNARTALASIEPKANLARALRGGVFAELAWPAFESAVAELGATSVTGFFPYAIVMNATRAIVVDGARRVLEHDLRLTPKARIGTDVFFVPTNGNCADGADAGELYVSFWDAVEQGHRAYWSGTPTERFTPTTMYWWGKSGIPVPGGGISFGARPFCVGDTRIERRDGVLADGSAFFAVENERGKLAVSEIDPRTGQKLRAAMPSIVARTLGEGMRLTSAELQPAHASFDASPLGQKDGVLGHWTVSNDAGTAAATFGADGRSTERRARGEIATAMLTFPGDARPRALSEGGYPVQTSLSDPDGRALGAVGQTEWTSRGWKLVPPLRFWHYLRPRDASGSAALRGATDELAGKLLAIARAERGESKEWPKTAAAVRELLPEIASEELRAGVAAVVVRAAQLADHLATLVAARTDPGAATAAEPTRQGPDDAALRAALGAMVEPRWGQGESVREMLGASRALAHGGLAGAEGHLHWELFFGRMRGVAFHALGVHVSDEHRKTLIALLEAWKETVFAREPAKVRIVMGTLSDASAFFRKEGDRPKYTWIGSEGESRYFVRIVNMSATLTPGTPRAAHFVEYARDGVFRVPPGFVVDRELRTADADAPWIEAFLAELASRGVPEWSPDVPAALAERSGLTRAEAILLWARLPGIETYGANFLEKGLRETIGVALGDARVARETFKLPGPDRLALFAAAAPADPRLLWEPLAPGDAGPVARLSAAWIARSGRRVALREEVVVMVDKGLDTPHAAAPLLHALVEPKSAPILAAPPPEEASIFEVIFRAQHPASTTRFTPAAVTSCAMLLPFLFTELPVGDPYRDALPGLCAAVRARLADPATLLPVVSTYGEPANHRALLESFGGRAVTLAGTVEARDDGTVIAALTREGRYFQAVVRSAALKRFADAQVLWKLHAATSYAREVSLIAAAFLEELAPAFLARLEKTPVPAGSFEANPALSAPDVVAAVVAKHKLSPPAAALYLQLLALAEPTIKRVQQFNGWKPTDYKKAEAELVASKLVVQGKRERAGREIFLPGGWDKSTGADLPQESWKKKLYDLPYGGLGRLLPPRPLHEMFEAAWGRVAAGDGPKFEEV